MTTRTPLAAAHPRAGFRQAYAAEWIKFVSVRSLLWTTVATALVPVLGAVFVAATSSLQPDDTVLGEASPCPSSRRCWRPWPGR